MLPECEPEPEIPPECAPDEEDPECPCDAMFMIGVFPLLLFLLQEREGFGFATNSLEAKANPTVCNSVLVEVMVPLME